MRVTMVLGLSVAMSIATGLIQPASAIAAADTEAASPAPAAPPAATALPQTPDAVSRRRAHRHRTHRHHARFFGPFPISWPRIDRHSFHWPRAHWPRIAWPWTGLHRTHRHAHHWHRRRSSFNDFQFAIGSIAD